jgi:hypothetical protein
MDQGGLESLHSQKLRELYSSLYSPNKSTKHVGLLMSFNIISFAVSDFKCSIHIVPYTIIFKTIQIYFDTLLWVTP